jgi:methylmalonyl-CoA mutase, N-terminal domain
VIVGVNRFADEDEPPSFAAPDYSALEKAQVKALKALRKKRNSADVTRTLEALRVASAKNSKAQLMPIIIDAVRARATVGEISETLASNWGFYRPRL